MKRAFMALSLVASSLLATTFTDISPNSSTHQVNTPVSSKDVIFTWSTPTVTDSTLAGYYYKIDTSSNTLVNSSDTSLSDTATSLTKTLSDGTYYLHIAPYAANGDIGATKHFGPIIVDTTAPATVTISPDSGTFSSAQTVTMGSSDANNYTIYYTTDGNDPTKDSTKYSSSFIVSSTKTIKAKACDVAGNCSGISSVTLTINLATNEAVVTTNIDGKTVATSTSSNSPSKVVQISIGGSSVTHYKYKFDSGSYSAQTAVSQPIDISNLSEGMHTLYVIGYDGSTWQSEASPTKVTFTVDNTAPEDVTFSPSGDEITGTNSATITLSSTGAKTIYYTLDGTVPTTSSSSGSSITLTPSNNGSLTIKAFSVDEAKNQSSIQTKTYTVNITTSSSSNSSSSGSSSSSSSTISQTDTTTQDEQTTEETEQAQTDQEQTATTAIEEIKVTEIDTGVTKDEPTQIKTVGDTKTATTKFKDKDGNVVEVKIEAKLPDVEVSEKPDGSVEAVATKNDVDKSLEIKTVVNPNGTSEASLKVTKADGSEANVKVAVAVVGADTSIKEDGSIEISAEVTTEDNTKANSQITAKSDGTIDAGLIIEKTDGTTTEVKVSAEVEGADATIYQSGNLKVSATLKNTKVETTAKTDGTVDSNIKVTDESGKEVVTKVVATIPDSDVSIKKDGTVEVITPTITLQNKKIAIKTVAKPDGAVKPVITVESSGATKEVELPEFDAGSKVEVKQVSGKVVVETKTAPMPKNKEIVF